MFPLIFQSLAIDDFHCEACYLAKHHQVPFPLNNNTLSFSLHINSY